MPDLPDLSDAARAQLRIHCERRGPIPVDDTNREPYRELARAGLMVALHTLTGGREARYMLTPSGRELVIATSARDRAPRPAPAGPIDLSSLSDAARTLLHVHCERQGRNAVDDTNREAYRELARAGIMIAVHTFTGGREARYQFTEYGWGLVNGPSPEGSEAPRDGSATTSGERPSEPRRGLPGGAPPTRGR